MNDNQCQIFHKFYMNLCNHFDFNILFLFKKNFNISFEKIIIFIIIFFSLNS